MQKTVKANPILSNSKKHCESLCPGNLLAFNISQLRIAIETEYPVFIETAEKISLFHHFAYNQTFVSYLAQTEPNFKGKKIHLNKLHWNILQTKCMIQ